MLRVTILIVTLLGVLLPIGIYAMNRRAGQLGLGYHVATRHILANDDPFLRISYRDSSTGVEQEASKLAHTSLRLTNSGQKPFGIEDVRDGPIRFHFPDTKILEESIESRSSADRVRSSARVMDHDWIAIDFDHLDVGDWIDVSFLHDGTATEPVHPPTGYVLGFKSGQVENLSGRTSSDFVSPKMAAWFERNYWFIALAGILLFFIASVLFDNRPKGDLVQYQLQARGPAVVDDSSSTDIRPVTYDLARVLHSSNDSWTAEITLLTGIHTIEVRELAGEGSDMCVEEIEVAQGPRKYDVHVDTPMSFRCSGFKIELREQD